MLIQIYKRAFPWNPQLRLSFYTKPAKPGIQQHLGSLAPVIPTKMGVYSHESNKPFTAYQVMTVKPSCKTRGDYIL